MRVADAKKESLKATALELKVLLRSSYDWARGMFAFPIG